MVASRQRKPHCSHSWRHRCERPEHFHRSFCGAQWSTNCDPPACALHIGDGSIGSSPERKTWLEDLNECKLRPYRSSKSRSHCCCFIVAHDADSLSVLGLRPKVTDCLPRKICKVVYQLPIAAKWAIDRYCDVSSQKEYAPGKVVQLKPDAKSEEIPIPQSDSRNTKH